jgi:hypothetical protein
MRERRQRRRGQRCLRRAREVRAQVAAIGFEDGLRHGIEQRALGAAHRVGAQQEGAALLVLPHAPRSPRP